MKSRSPVIIIAIILFIIPFFWLKPGEMDLGGDVTRLYFYDPLSYIKNYSLYNIVPTGTGLVEPNFYTLPISLLLFTFKSLLKSPYLVISLFNSLKLIVSFLAVYGIIKELVSKDRATNFFRELSAILGGLFYIFSRNIANYQWNIALLTHDQIFLNPLIFYLTLRYFLTRKALYVWSALLITFIFAHNFSWTAASPFFSFYPLAFLFIILYTHFIRKEAIPWKGALIGFCFFLLLHAFHLFPAFVSLFDPGSNINTRIFNRTIAVQQLDYFYGVLPLVNLSNNILLPSMFKGYLPFALAPFVVILGFLLKHKSKKTLLFSGIFFLITLYLLSAKVTDIGVKMYTWFFLYIPGFSMFRNFIQQWLFSSSFFYALLFGQAIFVVFSLLKKRYVVIFSLTIGIILTISAWPFITGELQNKSQAQEGIKVAILMDSRYEELLRYVQSLPDDAKILTLPFTDPNYQVIHGINNGAYVGLSTIPFLSGKKDFAGYINIAPFSDIFLKLAKEKDYTSIKRMLSLLNIKYIFYNKDPLIYDTTFPGYPYAYVRNYFPNDQKGYGDFVSKIATKKIYEKGPYGLYDTDKQNFLPHFYITNTIITYDNNPKLHSYFESASSFFPSAQPSDPRVAYVERQSCTNLFSNKLCGQKNIVTKTKLPKIQFEKINPTKYKIKIFNAQAPYLLVFSEAYHKNWKVFLLSKDPVKNKTVRSYFDGEIEEGIHKNIFFDSNTFETLNRNSLQENRHVMVNGYANGWHIIPSDVEKRENYEFIVEMTGQRVFYWGLALSIIVFLGCISFGVRDIMRRRND